MSEISFFLYNFNRNKETTTENDLKLNQFFLKKDLRKSFSIEHRIRCARLLTALYTLRFCVLVLNVVMIVASGQVELSKTGRIFRKKNIRFATGEIIK